MERSDRRSNGDGSLQRHGCTDIRRNDDDDVDRPTSNPDASTPDRLGGCHGGRAAAAAAVSSRVPSFSPPDDGWTSSKEDCAGVIRTFVDRLASSVLKSVSDRSDESAATSTSTSIDHLRASPSAVLPPMSSFPDDVWFGCDRDAERDFEEEEYDSDEVEEQEEEHDDEDDRICKDDDAECRLETLVDGLSVEDVRYLKRMAKIYDVTQLRVHQRKCFDDLAKQHQRLGN